jgi:hypothetical protein
MAVTINADTSNGLVMTPDTSGEINLQASGATIATVDSSGLSITGRIQTSAQPAFSAYKTSGQNNGGVNGGNDVVVYDGTFVDTTSSFDLVNNRYVAPVTGNYLISFNLTVLTSGLSIRYFRGKIFKNGTTILFASHGHISNETSDSDYASCSSTAIVPLTAGDYIDLRWGTGTASTVSLINSEGNNTLSGYLIG